MYVWAAFEAKSPPTRQDLATLIDNYTLYHAPINTAQFYFPQRFSDFSRKSCTWKQNKYVLFRVFGQEFTGNFKKVFFVLFCFQEQNLPFL